MEKKEYEKPQMKAIEIMNEDVLLSASTPGFDKPLEEGEEFE